MSSPNTVDACPECGAPWPDNLCAAIEHDRIAWWHCTGNGCRARWERGALPASPKPEAFTHG
jgi:hypothetical protein